MQAIARNSQTGVCRKVIPGLRYWSACAGQLATETLALASLAAALYCGLALLISILA